MWPETALRVFKDTRLAGSKRLTNAEHHDLAYNGCTAAPAGGAQRFPCVQNHCRNAVILEYAACLTGREIKSCSHKGVNLSGYVFLHTDN